MSVCKFRDGLSTTSKNSLNIAKFFERKSMATKNCGVTGGGGWIFTRGEGEFVPCGLIGMGRGYRGQNVTDKSG